MNQAVSDLFLQLRILVSVEEPLSLCLGVDGGAAHDEEEEAFSRSAALTRPRRPLPPVAVNPPRWTRCSRSPVYTRWEVAGGG